MFVGTVFALFAFTIPELAHILTLLHSGFNRGIDLDLLVLFHGPFPPERVQRAEASRSACFSQHSGSYLNGVFFCLEDLGYF